MDGTTLAFFLAAAFFGGLTSGLSGFAMGLVVSGVWLHIITPTQNALLIVLCGLVTQGSGICRSLSAALSAFRRAQRCSRPWSATHCASRWVCC
jgi:hypothetical protein